MPKKITTDEFIAKAKQIHGDKYGYNDVEYKGMYSNVRIYCHIHGYFEQKPTHHIHQKSGCPQCATQNSIGKPKHFFRKKKKGIGVLDVDFSRTHDEKTSKAYFMWSNILYRCYEKDVKKKYKSYSCCYVCDDWKYFSKFLGWFNENYVEGYAIDKDIIKKGNKCYCPEYCCFVPQIINNVIETKKVQKRDYPIGVYPVKSGKFIARVREYGKTKRLGTFDTQEQAFFAYKEEKERHLKEIAEKYFNDGLITKRVYDALCEYKIEITD